MSRRDLGGKKPSNGSNTADRRSNLRSKGKKWREQLVQGVKERELADALNQKLDAQRQMIRDRKIQLKKEAKQLDIELGFVDPSETKVRSKVPEWKKQKNFLNAIFPPPVICRKYNNVMVYRNKLSMQEYWHRVVTAEEWDANMELLNEMRAIYDQENPEQQGIGADEEEEGHNRTQEQEDAVDEVSGEESGEDNEGEEEGEVEGEEDGGAAAHTASNTDYRRAEVVMGEASAGEEEEVGSEGEENEEGEGEDEEGEEEDEEEEGEGSGAESESESVDETEIAKLSVA